MAKDFVYRELAVGDEVVYMLVGCRQLRKGTITRITEHYVFIDDGRPHAGRMIPEVKQKHNQVVKV